jgi:hypothetical protein
MSFKGGSDLDLDCGWMDGWKSNLFSMTDYNLVGRLLGVSALSIHYVCCWIKSVPSVLYFLLHDDMEFGGVK